MSALQKRFLGIHATDYDYFISVCRQVNMNTLWQDSALGVSIGNILCHVAEMERFWIDWGLCGDEFDRDRQIEFDRSADLTNDQLIARLEARRDETARRVEELPDEQWLAERYFHGETFTGVGILAWHLHHLGTHRGQIQMRMKQLG